MGMDVLKDFAKSLDKRTRGQIVGSDASRIEFTNVLPCQCKGSPDLEVARPDLAGLGPWLSLLEMNKPSAAG